MSKRIGNIEDHVIVCGFGRFGRVVTNELLGAGRQVVVIEQDPELEPELDRIDVAYLIGSATSDELLEVAGIRRASAIVVAVASESDCVFVALASHELNPEITIHARGESDAAVRRLRRAGAHHVTSPLQMGGMRAAASILRPNVVDFLELSAPSGGQAIDLEEIQLERGSPLHGSDLKAIESELPLLRVVALKRGGEPLTLVPRDMVVEGGDFLVAIGNRDQLAILAEKAQRSSH